MAFENFEEHRLTVEEINELIDADEVQDVIDELDSKVRHIKAQLEYRSEAPKGWEASAIAALAAHQILHGKAVKRFNYVTGRTRDNTLAGEIARQTKAQNIANNLEKQKIAEIKRQAKAEKQRLATLDGVITLLRVSRNERAFMREAQKQLSQETYEAIQAAADRQHDEYILKLLEVRGLRGLLNDFDAPDTEGEAAA